jgi:hypothetical protein
MGGDVANVLATTPLGKQKVHPFSPLRTLTCIQFGGVVQQVFGTTSTESIQEIMVIIARFSEIKMRQS